MKTIIQRLMPFLLLTIIVNLTGCEKESKETIVKVTVTNFLGLPQPNFTVYQMDDLKWNAYGANTFFRDQQSVTDENGNATFKIDNFEFVTEKQLTYYFFCNYTVGGGDPRTKHIGTTLSKGDSRMLTLELD